MGATGVGAGEETGGATVEAAGSVAGLDAGLEDDGPLSAEVIDDVAALGRGAGTGAVLTGAGRGATGAGAAGRGAGAVTLDAAGAARGAGVAAGATAAGGPPFRLRVRSLPGLAWVV